jgi:hypothetical protein
MKTIFSPDCSENPFLGAFSADKRLKQVLAPKNTYFSKIALVRSLLSAMTI